MKNYSFEIYTLNPETLEKGWNIELVDIFANCYKEAKNILKKDYPFFDCIILFNGEYPLNKKEIQQVNQGIKFKETSPNELGQLQD
jgi:hypothetical protein